MPLFGNTSPFDGDIDKATSEQNTSENWSQIMDICDRINQTSGSEKDALRSITKKMHSKIPNVQKQALSLLGACISNCGKQFHLEVCSRDFTNEIRAMLKASQQRQIKQKILSLLKQWSNDFKNDPQLSLIPSLYNELKKDHDSLNRKSASPDKHKSMSSPKIKDETDLAKAIELSLDEAKKSKSHSPSRNQPLVYPTFPSIDNNPSSYAPMMPQTTQSTFKVKAIYDFEAAEDNEITFFAGDIITVLDDKDVNWWKGETKTGVGLFPANFVSTDLKTASDPPFQSTSRAVSFKDEVKVVEREGSVCSDVCIDEDKIDRCIQMLATASTNLDIGDPEELPVLEDQCNRMAPLIDSELERLDKGHESLSGLNEKVCEYLTMYHNLMKKCLDDSNMRKAGQSGVAPSQSNLSMTSSPSVVAPMMQQYQMMPPMNASGSPVPMMANYNMQGMVPNPQFAGVAPNHPGYPASMGPMARQQNSTLLPTGSPNPENLL